MAKNKVCVGQLLPKLLGIQGVMKRRMDDLGWGKLSRYPKRSISYAVPFFLLRSRNLLIPDNCFFLFFFS